MSREMSYAIAKGDPGRVYKIMKVRIMFWMLSCFFKLTTNWDSCIHLFGLKPHEIFKLSAWNNLSALAWILPGPPRNYSSNDTGQPYGTCRIFQRSRFDAGVFQPTPRDHCREERCRVWRHLVFMSGGAPDGGIMIIVYDDASINTRVRFVWFYLVRHVMVETPK